MQKWPFMLAANRWLDYRIVLLPEFIKTAAQLGALTAIADQCLQSESVNIDSMKMDSPQLGKLVVWYEKQVARIDGKDLIDRVGRPIFRVQGIILRNYSSDSEAMQPIDSDLVRRMRAKADAAFAAFGTSRTPVGPKIEGELAPAVRSAPHHAISGQIGTGVPVEVGGMSQDGQQSRPYWIQGIVENRRLLLPIAAAAFVGAGALSLYAANRASQTEAGLQSESVEVERLKDQIKSLQLNNVKLSEGLYECNTRLTDISKRLQLQ